jgi:hypothetical protein
MTLLSDALALWRGPALTDFVDEPFAAPAIQRLEEERLARWRSGPGYGSRSVSTACWSASWVTLSPGIRCGSGRALQLRALYRAGRLSEALDSYAELRKRLADELGLEPGTELASLHQAIMEQDPELDGHQPWATSAARPRTNLPAPSW